MTKDLVLILDFGSQTTQLIARRIRESKVYCEILPCTTPFEEIQQRSPRAIVLSGGPASVYEDGAPSVDKRVFELGLPVLGICYGMQLMAHLLGGKVARADKREFGLAQVSVEQTDGIFHRFAKGERIDVWMSHGDRVDAVPPGFVTIGLSGNTPFCAVANAEKKMYGVQFHPEVVHSPRGTDVLASFLFQVAGLEPTWTPGSFTDDAIAKVKATVKDDEHAICGLSGGVDSSVAAILCHKALGDRLTCIFVDNGLLRQGEFEQVVNTFNETFKLNLIAVDARDQFLSALKGVSDPEKKRKIIGKIFIDVFDAEAAKVKGAAHLVQGTLYPDVIESVSFKGPSAVIKSHHNVGGLPEHMKLKLIEPLRELFKDEVRAAGETLGMPRDILYRQPFPGPGSRDPLSRRDHPGAPRGAARGGPHRERGDPRLRRLRPGLAVVLRASPGEERRRHGRQPHVRGDLRDPRGELARRHDGGLVAPPVRAPRQDEQSHHQRGTRGINRVVYDISSKPPATIEWE